MTDQATDDFIFGTLATDELRLEALRAGARGVSHANDIQPADPRPGEPVTIVVHTGPAADVNSVVVRYTLDGSSPNALCDNITCQRTEPVWDTLL